MVTPSMRTLVLVLAASALGGTACDTKKSAPTTTGDAGTTSASGTASSASQGAVAAGPGCALVTRGGAVLPKLAPGTLSIAAAHGKALVVDATFAAPPAGEKESPVPTAHAERILLNGAGAPDGDMTPIFDALPQGPGVLTFANAMSFQGELTTVSFAAKRPAPAECTDGVLALNGARAGGGATRHELVTHACRPATDVRGAARHDLGIVFTDGLAANEPSSPSPPAVANVWILDKLTTAPLRAESVAGTAPVAIEAPAVAAGTTIVAAAWWSRAARLASCTPHTSGAKAR